MQLKTVKIEKPDDTNFILGQTHFIKSVEVRLCRQHFTASETVRDIVIGMSDGLTVPFALAAGLSGAVEASAIIITARGLPRSQRGRLLWV